MLAGAGALVDYWPVGINLPFAAPAATASPMISGPLDVPADPMVLAGGTSIPVVQISPVSQPAVTPAPALDPLLSAIATVDPFLTRTVTIDAPPPPVAALTVAPELRETMSTLALAEARLGLDAPVPMLFADASGHRSGMEDGLLAGAFRKTGTSIVRTSMRTGSSLADAFRVVGSVVRRVWPD